MNDSQEEKPQSIPWKQIATSAPVWAITATHVTQNFGKYIDMTPCLYWTLPGYYILLTELPNYMKNVLHWEEKAILTGLPYLAMWLVSGVSSILVDSIIERELMSRTGIRKIANTIATLGPALAVLGRKLYFCCPTFDLHV